MNQKILKELPLIAGILICLMALNLTAYSQTLYDSFTDGNFTVNPVWNGTTGNWAVVADSDAAAGATGSNTVRLSVTASTAGTDYLTSQINNFGSGQEWGLFIGRRAQAFTAANQQYFWLFANEADLTSNTVDGYRIAIGDDTGNDEIRLEYIVNGAVSATVISSTGSVPNGLTDIGLLVRVTRSSSGNWELFTSPLPTANSTGAIATDVPNATNASVIQGTGINNSLAPVANNYIGLAALHSTGAAARVAAEFDQIYFSPTLTVTASHAMVSGRVTDARGRGLANVRVMMLGGKLNEPVWARTSAFGYYQFDAVDSGETYVLTLYAKKFYFTEPTRVVTVNSDTTVDFHGAIRGLQF